MKNILKEIKRSYKILDMKDDWDQQGASGVDLKIFNKSMLIIHTILDRIDNVVKPEINLCRDSTIDIVFRWKTTYIMLNVERDRVRYLYLYGTTTITGNTVELDEIVHLIRKYNINEI